METWDKQSWQNKYYLQQVEYPCQQALNKVLTQLQAEPALVKTEEINVLKTILAQVAVGDGFIIQGGDCAESFE